MKLVFEIDPVPASRPQVTRWGVFYPKKYKQFRKDMDKLLLKEHRVLLDRPLKLDVTFFVHLPKSYSKKKRDEMDGTYCATTFDLDNLEKAIYDCMTGYIYVDDRQIVQHTTRKVWVKEKGSIAVIIESL